jgi:signal transduction histidine kinase
MLRMRQSGKLSIVHLGLALAYTATGKLALLLAVPPGYASPIFPPAGIAVAAMLIGGRATLPWTFLGSLLLNIWTGYSPGHGTDAIRLAAASVIAAASMLQAAVGGIVLRRVIGYPAPLDNIHEVVRFLLLSPVFCLISATLSLAGLSALGLVELPDLLTNWVSWWLGDTLGVLVVLPLTMVIAGEPRDLWSGRAWSMALPMLLFFALFVAIFVRVNRWESDESLLEYRLLSQQIVEKIRTGLEQSVFLEQLERSFSLPGALSAADFRHLVQNLLTRFPLIQAVEWAPRVDSASRATFEAAQQADWRGFEIREKGALGGPRRAQDRAQYYPVTYIEPFRGNEQAVGFDLASEPNRKNAVEAAIKTGRIAATAPIRLVQEKAEQAGILLIFPVLDGPLGPGVLLVVHRMGTFVDGLLAQFHSLVGIRLTDLDADKVLYDGLSSGDGDARYEDVFSFGGRNYGIATAPTRAYLEHHRLSQSWGVLVAGVTSTGLLGALLLLGTGYTRRVEIIVDERTRELESANRRLYLEIEERQQAEAALRQAQRMEAIGQLTGGIAHDFNNLLTVMSGNAALLSDHASDDTVRRRASAIQRAADQGERLTRQLLAFSRRQPLRPEPVDLRQRRQEIVEMLSQSLRDDIELTVEVPEDLWPIMVDPTELELALLNIGVNARDAMPNGGRLCVEARNFTFSPSNTAADENLIGDFVALRLSDTGTGMAAEVRARAFEPFFTTKEVGLGSGLGLSQVYGFAKQSGGAALIDSEIGKGTTITLHLRRAATAPVVRKTAVAGEVPATVSARILLVEDDREVENVAAELLHDIGCQVVQAHDGESALAVLERDPEIELVISDIAMPGGMSGLQLARIVRERHPSVPILLATGYSQYAAQVVNEGFTLIEKPYRTNALAAVIRKTTIRV